MGIPLTNPFVQKVDGEAKSHSTIPAPPDG